VGCPIIPLFGLVFGGWVAHPFGRFCRRVGRQLTNTARVPTSQTLSRSAHILLAMPRDLVRIQQSRELHFITFSCYQHAPLLATPAARKLFEITLERVRRWYGFFIVGYVVMPDHVHLLISEPERGSLAVAVQILKQITSRKIRALSPHPSAKSAERVGHPRLRPFDFRSGQAPPAEREGHPQNI